MVKLLFSFLFLLAFCLKLQVKSFVTEPICSKFDYEEKLLEKMIRLEHSSNLMMESFREISTQVKTDMLAVKEEFEEVKKQASEQRHNAENIMTKFENDVAVLKSEVQTFVSEQRNESRKVLQDEIDSFRETVAETKDHLKKPVCAFSATTVTNIKPRSAEPLIFEQILLNDGDAYDSATGIFTTPQNGTHVFSFSLCFRPKSESAYQIVADGNVVSKVYNYDTSYIESVSSFAVVSLTVGMRVWVEGNPAGSSGLYSAAGSWCWNRFSGHIVN